MKLVATACYGRYDRYVSYGCCGCRRHRSVTQILWPRRFGMSVSKALQSVGKALRVEVRSAEEIDDKVRGGPPLQEL